MQQRTALVIAGTKGIGGAVAERLAAMGQRVAVMGRDTEACHAIAERIGGIAIAGDYTEPGTVTAAVNQVARETGRLDILVNGAGHGPKGSLTELTRHDWEAGFNIYFHHVVEACQAARPQMTEQGGGSIVNISSSAPWEPSPRFPTSMVARAALTTWVKLWSHEVAGSGIRVNNVLPGYTVADPAEVPQEWTQAIPLQRAGSCAEVASLVAYLTTDEAAYITGQNFRIDGGISRSI